jgi:hypothetical protein
MRLLSGLGVTPTVPPEDALDLDGHRAPTTAAYTRADIALRTMSVHTVTSEPVCLFRRRHLVTEPP